ncbi:MAG: AgmX/PglI C-terminal domain-containing protein, partial [Myxococcota bacterium]|nr:AgmX/PglI C-terminal domain-containing protein [Myxococcota bacterium]
PGQVAGAPEDAPPWRGLVCEARPGTKQGRACPTGHRAWCDLAGEQSACCATGLVPTGSRGACVCPPGGVSAEAALASGCPAGDIERDSEAIRTTMAAMHPAVKACYEDALEGGGQLAGLVSVVVERGPWGTAEKVSIGRSSWPNEGAQNCVLDVVAAAQLPPPVDGLGKVGWPFRFEPGPLSDGGGSGTEGNPSAEGNSSEDKTKPATRRSPPGEGAVKTRRPAQKLPRPPELAKAEAALGSGRDALRNNRTAAAIREAKRSLVYQNSIPRPQAEAYAKLCAEARAAAYELMAKAHCKDLNLPGAKGALSHLGRRGKKDVRKYCREVGLDL